MNVSLRVNLGVDLSGKLNTGLDDQQIDINVTLGSERGARDKLCTKVLALMDDSRNIYECHVVPIRALSSESQIAHPQSTFKVTPALAEKTTGITLIHTM